MKNYDDKDSERAERVAARHQQDFDDQQREVAGLDVGRIGRFLPDDLRNPDAAEKRKAEQTQQILTRLQMMMRDPEYAALHKETTNKLREAQNSLDEMREQQTLALDDALINERAGRAKHEMLHGMLFGGADPVKAGLALRALDYEMRHQRKQARLLLTPDEILAMPANKALVWASGYGVRPFAVDKVPYYTCRAYAGRFFPKAARRAKCA